MQISKKDMIPAAFGDHDRRYRPTLSLGVMRDNWPRILELAKDGIRFRKKAAHSELP